MSNNDNFNDIPKLRAAVEREATQVALLAAGIDVHGQALELTPVRTGNLKGSLSYATDGGTRGGLNSDLETTLKQRTSKDGSGMTNTTPILPPMEKNSVDIGTNVEYAADVEFGGRNRPAKSFLRKALDLRQNKLPEIMQKTYARVLSRIGRP